MRPAERRPGRLLLVALGLALATLGQLVMSGCAHGPLPVDHRPQSLAAALADQAPDPATLARRGWARLLSAGDFDLAAAELEQAAAGLATFREPDRIQLRQRAWLGAGLARLARARFSEAMPDFAKAVEADPAAPEGLVAALQLSETAGQTQAGHARMVEQLTELLSRQPPPGPEASRALRWILRDAASRAGDWRLARTHEQDQGVPPAWLTVTPLGRHPLVDFEQEFAPEREPLVRAALPDWVHPRPAWPVDGRLHLTVEPDDGLLYAETYFRLDHPQELSLRLGGQHSWVVFVDDRPMGVQAAHLAHLPGVVRLWFAAPAGWHRLLLKVPTRQGAVRLAVELTRRDGTPAALTWWQSPEPAPAYSPGSARVQSVPGASARQTLAQASVDTPHDAIAPLLAALLFWEAGDLIQARVHLDAAAVRAPGGALPDYLTALVMLEDPDLPPGIDQVRARERLEQAIAKRADFDLAHFRMALIQAALGQEDRALAGLERLDRQRPDSFLWPYYAGRIQDRLGWEPEARQAYRRALERMPDQVEVLERLFELATRSDDLAGQIQLAERLESLGRADERHAELWFQRGEAERARALLERIIERNPGQVTARLRLVDLLLTQEKLDEASGQLAGCELVAPLDLEVRQRNVALLERQGALEQALAMRAELARKHPWHLPTRKALAAARGQASVAVAADESIDALGLIARHQAAARPADGDALLLLDQATVEVAPDGSSLERVHSLVQVLTPEGLEQWGETDLVPPGAEVEQLRTISATGQIHEAELIPGKDSITLPALQVGDYVEIAYVHGSRNSPLVNRGYLGRGFLFQLAGTPILHSSYRLAVPTGSGLVVDRIHKAPEPSRSVQAGLEIYRFEQRDAPALVIEAHGPPQHEFTPLVQTGWGITWRDLRDVRRAELLEAARLTPGLVRYAQAVAGQGPTEVRLARLFGRVGDEIRQVGEAYDFGQPASYTLARREGNRLVLLYTLLRGLGHQPRVLLARTLAHAQIDYQLPSDESFSHGLLSLELEGADGAPGRIVWLDPSQRYNPFDVLDPILEGMPAIEVTGTDPERVFVRLPDNLGVDQAKRIDLDLELFADGTLAGTGRESISTSQAARYRELLISMTQSQRRQALDAGLGGYFSGSLLEDFALEDLEDPARPLVIRYRFRAPAWAARRGDALVMQGGFYPYQLAQNLITGASRQIPLLITDLTRTRTRVHLKLPPGTRVELPEPVKLSAPLSEFEMRVLQEGDRLVIDKSLIVRPGRVSPSDYPAFRDFCRRVDTRDSARIIVQPTGPAGS